MTAVDKIVIVGGGLGGAKTAEALREHGYSGTITLPSAETHLPYERPPLSKSYLTGASPFEDALVHPADWYREHNIDLRLGTRATAVDAAAHQVQLADADTSLRTCQAVQLATTGCCWPPGRSHAGCPYRARTDTEGVLHLRSREDADAIRTHLGKGNDSRSSAPAG